MAIWMKLSVVFAVCSLPMTRLIPLASMPNKSSTLFVHCKNLFDGGGSSISNVMSCVSFPGEPFDKVKIRDASVAFSGSNDEDW